MPVEVIDTNEVVVLQDRVETAEVRLDQSIAVAETVPGSVEALEAPAQEVEIADTGPQGPQGAIGPQEVFVQSNDPGEPDYPSIWIEWMGDDFEVWFTPGA